jgi:predicted nuclease of predicted toxin-antitoxin system
MPDEVPGRHESVAELVKYLAEAGFESVHWSEIGSGSAPDAELMAWATERGYVVLTTDLDFGAILAATRGRSPSVVQLRSDILTPRSLGEAVVTAIKLAEQGCETGHLSLLIRRGREFASCLSCRPRALRFTGARSAALAGGN